MRILQVTPFFSPVHGGSAEVPYQMSRELLKRGHEVTVYTTDYELGREYVHAMPAGSVRVFRAYSNLVKLLITPGMMLQARREVRSYDLIHMHNHYTFQSIVIRHYARRAGVPYIVQAHGALSPCSGRRTMKRAFNTRWGYRILRDASKVIAVSPAEAEQYRNMGVPDDRIEVVPNGIDLSEFENLPELGQFRERHGLTDAESIVLYLGRIHRTKGLDLLTEAFADLLRELDGARLVIAGPDDGYLGAVREQIRDLGVEDKVLLTGPLYGEEKIKAYVDADVFVLSSRYEIFGIAALEACACGTAVVATTPCGIADVVCNRAGLVVPCDRNALAKAIVDILSDHKKRQGFREQGRLLVREKFNWERIAEQVEDIYHSCLSAKQ